MHGLDGVDLISKNASKLLGLSPWSKLHVRTVHLKVRTINIRRPILVAIATPGTASVVTLSLETRVLKWVGLDCICSSFHIRRCFAPTPRTRCLPYGNLIDTQCLLSTRPQMITRPSILACGMGGGRAIFTKVLRKNV